MWLAVDETGDIGSVLDSAGALPQYGAAALISFLIACLVMRKFFVPEWYARQMEKERDEARKEASDLQVEVLAMLRGEVVPALTQAAAAQATFNQEMQRRRWQTGGGSEP